jgi:hypothetical protein
MYRLLNAVLQAYDDWMEVDNDSDEKEPMEGG